MFKNFLIKRNILFVPYTHFQTIPTLASKTSSLSIKLSIIGVPLEQSSTLLDCTKMFAKEKRSSFLRMQ
jgi:hypothetical protein